MATLAIRWLKRGSLAIAAIVLFYLIAALFGSILPANQSWQSSGDGVELFVETNGLHTGIIMPVWNEVHDWTPLVRPQHLGDPSTYGSHILVGWGHAGIYRNTPRWRDLRLQDVMSATFGSDEVLLHVYHLNHPQAYPHYRRSLKVSKEEYRKIAKIVAAKFTLNQRYQSIPLPGYGRDDSFYQSHGYYSAFNTCNNWTNDVLKQAGIRTGLWTPFQGGVMRWRPDNQPEN